MCSQHRTGPNCSHHFLLRVSKPGVYVNFSFGHSKITSPDASQCFLSRVYLTCIIVPNHCHAADKKGLVYKYHYLIRADKVTCSSYFRAILSEQLTGFNAKNVVLKLGGCGVTIFTFLKKRSKSLTMIHTTAASTHVSIRDRVNELRLASK